MVRKITIAKVNELQDRFRLQEIEKFQRPWTLNEVIQPTYEMKEVLSTLKVEQYNVSVVTVGTFTVVTVPNGKQWEVYAYEIRATSTNTYDTITIAAPAPSTVSMIIQMFTASSLLGDMFPVPLNVKEGTKIQVRCAVCAATEPVYLSLLYREIDV